MQPFLLAIEPYLSNPLFQVVFSGIAASLVHSALKARGLVLSKAANFWFSALFSAAPFLVLAAQWGTNGIPAPDMFFVEILGCIGAAQTTFWVLKKKVEDGSIDTLQIPVFSEGSVSPSAPAQEPVAVLSVPASETTVSAPATIEPPIVEVPISAEESE